MTKMVELLLQSAVVDTEVAKAAAAGFVCGAQLGGQARPVAGASGSLPGGQAATTRTLFDLASVSKPVVACAAARLVARGELSLASPLGAFVPEVAGTPSQDVPLELLLAHRAGLEPHRPLFAALFQGRPFSRSRAIREAANARRADCQGPPPEAGFAPIYSDLGYALFGLALAHAAQKPLDEVIRDEVTVPLRLELGSARLLRQARNDFAWQVAPTETLLARGGSVRGIVHDENAWALAGHGAAGHAGLFGTIDSLLVFGAALLDAHAGRSVWLSAAAFGPLVRPRAGGTLRAGFDGKSPGASSAGALCGPQTFGHLGFTGTSLWCDPGAEIATVLLTNRVCPARTNLRIRAARPEVHDELFRFAERWTSQG